MQRTKQGNWSLGLSILTALLTILAAPLANTTLPPTSYIIIAIYLTLQITVIVLGILGLKSIPRGRAIAGLVIIALTFLIFEPFAISGIRDNGVKQKLAEIENAVGSACDRLGGNPAAAAYVPGPGLHPMIAIFDSALSPATYTWVERASWPDSLASVELVVCLNDEYSIHMSECEYTSGTIKERAWRARDVRLVTAQTGELIAETTIKGDNPDRCPENISQGDKSTIYGSHVYRAEIDAWLQKVLNP